MSSAPNGAHSFSFLLKDISTPSSFVLYIASKKGILSANSPRAEKLIIPSTNPTPFSNEAY